MIISVILFLIVLAVLIFVHELGHFIVAKFAGIRVDEFAIGFPPRLWSFRRGETQYSINLIPFGGYVKIFGENPDDLPAMPESARRWQAGESINVSRSFAHKPKYTQAVVLAAGVTFNVLFAWLLFSASLMSGATAPVGYLSSANVKDAHVVITDVLSNSPADKAGLSGGQTIDSVSSGSKKLEGDNLSVSNIQNLIAESNGTPLQITYEKNNEINQTSVVAESGLVEGKLAIGISMDTVGILKENPIQALFDGAKITGIVIYQTAIGLFHFLGNAVIGHANFSEVAGPVGIVGYVGEAYSLGILYLIAFTSLISINLAIINLLPFPALDGGRLLFVVIEAIKGSPIKPKVANTLNSIGFALLILLMVVVTYHDIAKFFIK